MGLAGPDDRRRVQPGDPIIVASVNISHLARYCDARLWTTIT
jgi:hypothetical protein